MEKLQLEIDNINFHDAIIKGLSIEKLDKKTNKLTINCKIYLSNDDKERIEIQIIFEKIKMGSMIFNSSELLNNIYAGNISSCYIYKNTYQFNLFGGYIEIKSKIPPKIFKTNEETKKVRDRCD